ncbi:phosphopantetheine-binding protein [Streptomyces sp. M19]
MRDAAVAVRRLGDHDVLAGYVVAEPARRADRGLTRDALAALGADLPGYLVPAVLTEVATLPLTASGKVDRQALPEPVAVAADDEWQAPANDVERRVSEIWARRLGVPEVGRGDNFFHLGGDSLMAMRVTAEVNRAFGASLTLASLIHRPTVAATAASLSSAAEAEAPDPPRSPCSACSTGSTCATCSSAKRGFMDDVYVSAIAYTHGERRPIRDLDEPTPEDFTLPVNGLAYYRVSDLPAWELGAVAGQRTLAEVSAPPDLLVYVNENDASSADSLARIALRLGLPEVDQLAVSGHGCGNLGPALRVAGQALASGDSERVLLIAADRVELGHVLNNGLSVLSDGAAACLLTAARRSCRPLLPGGGGRDENPCRERSAAAPDRGLLSMLGLAEDCVEEVLRKTGRRLDDFDGVVFGNYRAVSQKFLAAAMGLSDDRLLLGDIADLAHSFSADLLVTLEQLSTAGRLKAGARVLAAATGPHSWSVLAADHV